MPDLGLPELIIIALIVLLLFGPAKAADLGGALGRGIREFRHASREDADDAPRSPAMPVEAPAARYCTECGSGLAAEQKFCTQCGASTATAAPGVTG
ncbi:MAG TPA: twin-arginine translocase TatA/TatE family subunit [Dehalococcoidia bacterium]|jgi:sec-independent protein translocase protein TatA|nr:twin-arginine translocase TatA/TatE family subunit [Dehalococcoidia bacterium]